MISYTINSNHGWHNVQSLQLIIHYCKTDLSQLNMIATVEISKLHVIAVYMSKKVAIILCKIKKE